MPRREPSCSLETPYYFAVHEIFMENRLIQTHTLKFIFSHGILDIIMLQSRGLGYRQFLLVVQPIVSIYIV